MTHDILFMARTPSRTMMNDAALAGVSDQNFFGSNGKSRSPPGRPQKRGRSEAWHFDFARFASYARHDRENGRGRHVVAQTADRPLWFAARAGRECGRQAR